MTRADDWLSIGLVCPYSFTRPGGVQNHVLGLARWLRRRGHVVALLGPGHPDRRTLRSLGLPPECFTSTGRSVPVPANGSVARLNFGAASAVRVRSWMSDHCFDVIHLHEPLTPSSSLLALWNADRPLVATFHCCFEDSSFADSTLLRVARRLAPSSLARIDEAVAVSQAAAEAVRRAWRVDPVIIGNGVDTAELSTVWTAPAPWRGGEHPRVCFLGRFEEPRKGFSAFRRAVHRVRLSHPDVDAVVIGPGAVPGDTDGLRFLGPLSDADRDRVLGSCDVYVAPNSGGESFGIVLVEALAAGARVVASDLPGFREVLTDDRGLVGWLVPPADAAALSRAINQALGSGDSGLAARGLRRARQFDWESVGPQLEDQYRAAISSRRNRR
ncbi:glycosyltransferase family 4 protein [Acidipropionibacterium jensenii]|uniref:glycosyltransferase family 4 protein n=1 Tax=Acidipropionibacterium jensenii TaxID=1749 RepID=UPI0026470CB5|nr:glycosyltransferase family 4 protein [Acidipropionibacterium jensenii]MDN5976470.1 glycosyltransferase family 4 protein [Acidipropionibacterium jensenii]MDN5996424.1 glycosyltransferase family 4 protein [Acidipropionibacterium jensenii]MDN6425763.1 glycosyltransferase family 4 protein [Acidipropionibacterium jensenii]MDN6441549.1 glycosyltransferase family 4 protein [Acidipropionibacterium jensenii]MDN6480501.1 glycosyltransferase family 4 protein [Acidipropionibacterium jensenii]